MVIQPEKECKTRTRKIYEKIENEGSRSYATGMAREREKPKQTGGRQEHENKIIQGAVTGRLRKECVKIVRFVSSNIAQRG